uniref:CDKN1A interacting zinc finger protein 1 n=1 Tax=Oryctolagus cuniculus TaxID=9986 RepID=G1TAN2_RABIT
ASVPDQDSAPCPDTISREKHALPPEPEPEPEPEPCELSEPPAKRSKSSEEPAEPAPTGQLKVKVQPQARTTAPKQTQTPELLPEPVEARVQPRFQPRVLQVQAQVQPQTQPRMPPAEPRVQPKLQKQAQTQTSPEHLVPRQEQAQPGRLREAEPQKQVQPPVLPQAQPGLQPQEQPAEQLPERTQPHASWPAPEQAPVPVHATAPETPSDSGEAGEALPEPPGAQDGVEESGEEPARGLDVGECERRAREMLGTWGAGGSLKVTILQSSDSRAFSTTPLPPGPRPGGDASRVPAAASPPSKPGLQFFCYICKANCSSQQVPRRHPSVPSVAQRPQQCHITLRPPRSASPCPPLVSPLREPPPRRWCNTCQVYYVGDLIQHRRTQDHKIAKQSLRPFCTACSRYFRTPRKFVEHVKSQGHKDKAKELKMLEKEVAGQDEDHFITVDAVGCFEGDEDEEDDDEDDEEIEVEEELCKQVRSRDISIEEWKGSETYNPNTAYGVDFLVPVMGYVCRICHKFYHSNSGAQLSHCKSLAHFENLQKYKAAKNPSPTSRPVSRRCAINARNALTALFTAGGRSPIQPSTQDTAKTASKVTAQLPKPPPRRSTRLKS